MTYIMKQRGRTGGGVVLLVQYISFAQPIKNASHQMESAERVGEAGVFCALIGIESQSQLFDPSQPLKLLRVDQTHHQLAFATVSAKANYVVDRIAIDSFGQNSYLAVVLGDSLTQRKVTGRTMPLLSKRVTECSLTLEKIIALVVVLSAL